MKALLNFHLFLRKILSLTGQCKPEPQYSEIFYGFRFHNYRVYVQRFYGAWLYLLFRTKSCSTNDDLYVALHYGKPAGETISSFFGGYILGVLAYQSKNIWGEAYWLMWVLPGSWSFLHGFRKCGIETYPIT